MVVYGICLFVRLVRIFFALYPIVAFRSCFADLLIFGIDSNFQVDLIWRHTKPNTKHNT